MRTTLLSLALCGVAAAQESRAILDSLKSETDPTILKSRVWFDTEWNAYERGAHDGDFTVGGMWAWRVSPDQDWAVRLTVPYAWRVAGDIAGDESESALGDIEMATGTAFRLGKTWRTGIGLELHADTATNDAFGDADWRLKPFWNVAWDASSWLTLGFIAEYTHSIAEQERIDTERYAEFFLPVTFVLPGAWSLGAQYKVKCDFNDGDRLTQGAKVTLAKRLERAPLAFTASIERDLDGGEKKFEAHFVITWFFN